MLNRTAVPHIFCDAASSSTRVMRLFLLALLWRAASTDDGAPLRVVILHHTLQPGGAERHILNLVRSLPPARQPAPPKQPKGG